MKLYVVVGDRSEYEEFCRAAGLKCGGVDSPGYINALHEDRLTIQRFAGLDGGLVLISPSVNLIRMNPDLWIKLKERRMILVKMEPV
jgi:hypothetical protein